MKKLLIFLCFVYFCVADVVNSKNDYDKKIDLGFDEMTIIKPKKNKNSSSSVLQESKSMMDQKQALDYANSLGYNENKFFAYKKSKLEITQIFELDTIKIENEIMTNDFLNFWNKKIEIVDNSYKFHDDRLNANYKQIMSKLNKEGKKKLRNSQRNWIAFVDERLKIAEKIGIDKEILHKQMTAKQADFLEAIKNSRFFGGY